MALEAVQITPQLESYLEAQLQPRDPVLAALEREAEEKGVPIVGPQVGTLLCLFTGLLRPRLILELGCATGYSAIWLARGAPDARLITTELDRGRAEGSCIQTVTGRGYRMAVPVTRLPAISRPRRNRRSRRWRFRRAILRRAA